ncbi:MAG: hypothetical protein WC375_07515 [Methanomassiliicoccales archaeon]
MDVNKTVIHETLEYKFAILKKFITELQNRQNLFYYSYEPAGEKQRDFHFTPEKIRILDGVNRTGKSTTAFHDMYMFMAGEHPLQDALKMPIPNYWWVVVSSFRKVWETGGLWDEKVIKQLPMNMINIRKLVNKKPNEFTCVFKNGSSMSFISQEQGIAAFRSAAINGFLVDERITNEEIRGQLRMRIFDKGGIAIFNMDLLAPDEWVEELMLKKMAKKWTLMLDDNKFIIPEEKARLEMELSDAQKFFLLSGNRHNPNESHLFLDCWNDESWKEISPRRFDVDFRGEQFIDNKAGLLRVFLDKNPKSTYYIIVDSAVGVGHDETVVTVVNDECDEVSCWHSKDTRLFDQKHTIKYLSEFYNKAMVVVENNGSSGLSLIDGLNELDVPLYTHCTVIDNKIKNVEYGVKTEKNNKPEWVHNTEEDLNKGWLHIHYWVTKEQLENFGISPDGKYKGLKKLRWHNGLGVGDAEKDGNIIGEDDHCMAIIIADMILREEGHIGKISSKRIFTIDEQKKLHKVDEKGIFCNGMPIGAVKDNFTTY